MINADFCWNCPSCNHRNWEWIADDDKEYECDKCDKCFTITFSVNVDEIEAIEEDDPDDEQAPSTRLVTVGVSKDNGITWEEMTINSTNLDPATADVKEGWLLKNNGLIYQVYLHKERNMLMTKSIPA